VLLRFAHEMNGNWYQWGAGVDGNTPAQYVAAWRHVHDVFMAQGATNVKWVWCPNVLTGAVIAFEPFYPGDAYVDWLGLDGYNNVLWGDWQTFSQLFAASYQAITALSQHPLMIAETASSEAGGDKAAWITDALVTQIPNHFPRIDAVVWFNFNYPPDSADYRIESSRSAMAAFRAAVSSAVYRAQWP
jgi:beta-mannanase